MTCRKKVVASQRKFEDVIVQASCAAYMPHNPTGFVYAAWRVCSDTSPTCAQIYSNPTLHAQDIQTASLNTWTCIGAIQVYHSRNATGDGSNPILGPKQYINILLWAQYM